MGARPSWQDGPFHKGFFHVFGQIALPFRPRTIFRTHNRILRFTTVLAILLVFCGPWGSGAPL
jgi:hypothetical protein